MGAIVPQVITEDRAGGAQVIDGGLRFDSGKTQYLTRTPGSAGNRRTWTYSSWIKRSSLSTGLDINLLTGGTTNSDTGFMGVYIDNNHKLTVAGATTNFLVSSAVYRDVSSWYNIVVSFDATQGTNANKIKFYVNGVQLADFSTDNRASISNQDYGINQAAAHNIGNSSFNNLRYYDGLMTQVYLIDGQALDSSYFGYTDALTNTWRPKSFKSTLPRLNDGTTWDGTNTNSYDGVMINDSVVGTATFTGVNGNFTSTLSKSITVRSSLRLQMYLSTSAPNTYATIQLNGTGSQTITVFQSQGAQAGIYDVAFTGTLSSIKVTAQGGANVGLAQVIVDGEVLINGINDPNSFGRNGFYLPFDGNSPIGQDMSGRGNNWTPVNFGGSNTLEKATGALPILNTDGGGKVARVGVRTDSNSSSLVLALPLVGIKSDFSNKINGGTTEKVVTDGGITYPTTNSIFYGGSGFFNNTSTGDVGLTIPNSSDFNFGTGDFTIEFWIYNTVNNRRQWFLRTSGQDDTASTGFLIEFGTYNQFFFGSAGLSFINPPPLNTWSHIAITRSGTTLRLFVNGVLDASATNSTNITSSQSLFIGKNLTGYSFGCNMYLQDIRIYKGLAKYTQNFIPASTDPDILPDTPSGVAYSSNVALVPSTDGAVAFDGSGDYLNVGTSSDYAFGTGDFTMECFVYHNDLTGQQTYFSDAFGNTAGIYFCKREPVNGNVLAIYTTTFIVTGSSPLSSGRWHHIAVCRSSGTIRLFLNGVLDGSASDTTNLTQTQYSIGESFDGTSGGMNGFISNAHIVKGTALYTSNFTPPTAPITSVANTKLLCCKSNSSATVYDVSPGTITANGNAVATNFNPFTVNINTQRGQESGYATWNPLDNAGTLSNGNLDFTYASAAFKNVRATLAISSGKWYWEGTLNAIGGAAYIGIGKATASLTVNIGGTDTWGYVNDGNKQSNNTAAVSYGSSYTTGDVIGVLFDADAGTLTFYKNGVSQGQAYSGLTSGPYFLMVTAYNGTIWAANFGQKPFKFPPPAGFQPLALANTPRPTIVRPDQYVGIVTYTGTGATRDITVGWKPDFVWIKERGAGGGHVLYDTVRGATKHLASHSSNGENTDTDALTSFNSNGFSLGSGYTVVSVNGSTRTYVGWCWKAGGNSNTFNINDIGYSTASAAGLTAGTITPTGASVNTKSGFSIVTYTGTNANATISHGLGNVPAFIIAKSRDTGSWNWIVYHKSLGVSDYLALESTQGSDTRFANIWGTGHTTSVFGVRTGYSNNPNGERMVAYCWAEIPGFSKAFSYTGNGSANGPVINLGFLPRLILLKNTTAASTNNWVIYDTERNKFNETNFQLWPNSSAGGNTYDATATNVPIDVLSNGFKIRSTGGDVNTSTNTYIGFAWASSPTFNLYGGQSNAR